MRKRAQEEQKLVHDAEDELKRLITARREQAQGARAPVARLVQGFAADITSCGIAWRDKSIEVGIIR